MTCTIKITTGNHPVRVTTVDTPGEEALVSSVEVAADSIHHCYVTNLRSISVEELESDGVVSPKEFQGEGEPFDGGGPGKPVVLKADAE